MRRLLALVAAVGAALVPAGAGAERAPTAPGELAGVNFVSACGFGHRAADDPIVFPGRPGVSHDHTFVGNTTTNAFSTLRTMLRGGTTCRRAGDTAAYWMPTLYVDGRPVEPRDATIYYRRSTLAPVSPFPRGLKMIAGDAHADSAQPRRVTSWNCGAAADVPPSAEVPTCPDAGRSGLRLHVRFPSCWDGSRLDSSDHRSHMAYPRRGVCPASHPVAVPAIALIFRYPTAGGPGVTLASGGRYSAHADFFNAWRQGTLASLVERCLNALRHCGRGR